jgi:myo-inositol-1(or 4)-monophosphatase
MAVDDLHSLALQAARAGAAAIAATVGAALNVQTKTGAEDLVTDADHAAERAILDVIQGARPADEIIAEESGMRTGTSGVRWYVDPLDGTANFVKGDPNYAVSIAAYRDDTPVAGVIYRPVDNEWLATGSAGLVGSLTPRIAPDKPLSAARVTISRPHPPTLRSAAMRLRDELLPQVGEERRVGSAACTLLQVATGVIDGYIAVGLPLWDTAAGHQLVRLSGGRVDTVTPPGGTSIAIAGSPQVVTELRHAILTRGG